MHKDMAGVVGFKSTFHALVRKVMKAFEDVKVYMAMFKDAIYCFYFLFIFLFIFLLFSKVTVEPTASGTIKKYEYPYYAKE